MSDNEQEHMTPTVETVQESATELEYLHVEKPNESTPTASPSSIENTQEEETSEQDLDDSKPAAFVPNDDKRNGRDKVPLPVADQAIAVDEDGEENCAPNDQLAGMHEAGMEDILAEVPNPSIDQNLDATTREGFSAKEFNDPSEGIAEDKNIDHDAKEQLEATQQVSGQTAEFEGDETALETYEPETSNQATTLANDLYEDDSSEGETQIPLQPRVCDPEENLPPQYKLKDPPPTSAPVELNDHYPGGTSSDPEENLSPQYKLKDPPPTSAPTELNDHSPGATSTDPEENLPPQYKLKDPPPTSAPTELNDHSPGFTSYDFGGMELSDEVGTPPTGLQEEESDVDGFGFPVRRRLRETIYLSLPQLAILLMI